MAAGLADRRQPLEETTMLSSAKRIYKSPKEKTLLVRSTSVYWGDYRESCRKVGVNNFGMLAALLYEGIGLSIRNDVMPYRQLFGPVLDYACLIWICATRTHAHAHAHSREI